MFRCQVKSRSDSLAVPYRFPGLYTIGCIFFILNIVLFIFNVVMMSLRFYFHPSTFKHSLLHPTESLFIPASVISLGTILLNITEYGLTEGKTGSWLGLGNNWLGELGHLGTLRSGRLWRASVGDCRQLVDGSRAERRQGGSHGSWRRGRHSTRVCSRRLLVRTRCHEGDMIKGREWLGGKETDTRYN